MKIANNQNQQFLLPLYGLLHCSLARYLSYARPWSRRPNTLLMAVARKLADDHKHYADKIADSLASRRQMTSSPSFPKEYTYYNDIAIDHLAPLLLQQQRYLIGVASAASGAMFADHEMRQKLAKLLIALRKYADVLEELITRSGNGPALPVPVIKTIESFPERINHFGSALSEPQTAA